MEPSTLLYVLAIPCVVTGIAMMMAMVGALHGRGHKINWVLLRLFMPGYVAQYYDLTTEESGRPGPLFYPFLVSMNLALLLVILGFVLR